MCPVIDAACNTAVREHDAVPWSCSCRDGQWVCSKLGLFIMYQMRWPWLPTYDWFQPKPGREAYRFN
jgi:hypothetical protein